MRQVIIAGIVGLICAAGAAGAQEAASPSPAEIVAARQASFALSAPAFGGMRATVEAGGPVRGLAFASGGLAKWAAALPTLFPVGTGPDAFPAGTKAKAEIWTDRAGFEAKAADYAAATARLAELARADDVAGFAAQYAVVRQTCQACHDVYRVN